MEAEPSLGASASPPLDLRVVFASPWVGGATIWRPWWLRWLPIASRLQFRTEISDIQLAETSGLLVRDTTTFPNGRTWERTMRARLVGPGHWKISATDMPGGAEQRVTAEGFSFTPYTILAPALGPIRVPLRCDDQITMVDDSTMLDEIEMRFFGIRVGRLTMLLKREIARQGT